MYKYIYIQHEQAELEVDRLCDIIEKATDALKNARQIKRDAQKELDEAAKAINRSSNQRAAVEKYRVRKSASVPQAAAQRQQSLERTRSYELELKKRNAANSNGNTNGHAGHGGNALGPLDQYYSGTDEDSEDDGDYEEESEGESEGQSEYDTEVEENEVQDLEEDGGFDMGNEALEQVRYRLEVAKIDPNSPKGTAFLDELLLRLQDAKGDVIDTELVNEIVDELFEETNGSSPEQLNFPRPHPQNPNQQHSVIRIHRGGKALGWYQGELDERGYAREGEGSMYYDAGHESHGLFKNDEMVGRGVYQWADGHVYDGEWATGKRHGLGRFIRPDNVILYGKYVKGHHKGEGVRLSSDRTEAQLVVDGVPKKGVSLAQAKKLAKNLGFQDDLPLPV